MISSLIAGGITGLIGTTVQSVANYKGKKLDLEIEASRQATEVALKKADAEIMAQEWAARTKVAEVEAGAKESAADAEAFAKSFKDPKRYSEGLELTSKQAWIMVVLDFVRGMVRPGLTLYLCILTTLIYVQARSLLQGESMSIEQAMVMVERVVDTVLYLTTTCVTWWFGSRNKQKPPKTG